MDSGGLGRRKVAVRYEYGNEPSGVPHCGGGGGGSTSLIMVRSHCFV